MFKSQASKSFKDFCESTSLHGYTYLYMTSSITLKIFWIVVLLTMTSLGIMFLVRNTEDFVKSRIVTNIESASANLSVRT